MTDTETPPLRWEVYIEDGPLTMRGDIHEEWEHRLTGPLFAAVIDVAEAVDSVDCSRQGDAHPGTHPVGYRLHGEADEQIRWHPTLVRLTSPSSTSPSVELLCEDCTNAEPDAAGRCLSCAEHHHQGCMATTIGVSGERPCQCACRPVAWRQAVPA